MTEHFFYLILSLKLTTTFSRYFQYIYIYIYIYVYIFFPVKSVKISDSSNYFIERFCVAQYLMELTWSTFNWQRRSISEVIFTELYRFIYRSEKICYELHDGNLLHLTACTGISYSAQPRIREFFYFSNIILFMVDKFYSGAMYINMPRHVAEWQATYCNTVGTHDSVIYGCNATAQRIGTSLGEIRTI